MKTTVDTAPRIPVLMKLNPAESEILDLLMDGNGTSKSIGVRIGIRWRRVSAMLSTLRHKGLVIVVDQITGKHTGGHPVFVYQIARTKRVSSYS